MTTPQFFRRMHELSEQGEAFVVCTMLTSMGHAPQEPGAKALITSAGLAEGTVGGGKLENRAILEARRILEHPDQQRSPTICDWDLQKDIGMSCGGRATLLFEVFGAKAWNITVFGAGHVAQALCRVLLPLNCRLTCVDTRQDWIERLPEGPYFTRHTVDDMAAFATDLAPGTFCAVITMGHGTDLPVLKVLLARDDLPFVGSIGSKVKARAIKADLARAGLDPEHIQRLHCPIGLDLGSRLPEEIAISITAQLLLARDTPGVSISRSAGKISTSG
ncbi:MAG TPA: xanthine dehydrogenase accessory protein XdhC [Oligoflexus sp.]|uniref:xanthine dehydrogenase accessory protein XdhC n=1 Tax=Oligoflexus sp. TaxID=1971216 RepID=UPI002D43F183|nr:xanthine dehydrogenase accessory protein XdhC [Oligoflexus sp.]HYX34806.1 xanthine dehydrogenase accessory protein XdhC [Oligoflexus sp.]